jgi:[protein-PII] uridylyltransferase
MPLAIGTRPAVLAARQLLAEGRQRLRQMHARGTPGVQVCNSTAELLDRVVLHVYRAALADVPQHADALQHDVALVAHGGYGRRDTAPYSDIDLMLLHADTAARCVADLAGRLQRDLCDVGLTLGLSMRTIGQACQLAGRDVATFTSLLESRLLHGSTALFDRYLRSFRRLPRRRVRRLLAAIEQARNAERVQYGETVYLLEPNIKRSRGGLRDIQLIRWIGFVRHGVSDPDDLRLRGALTREDYRVVRDAAEFLLRVRNELHFHAGRAQDLLDRAEQVRVAEAFGFCGTAGLLPVEQFMREYFRHTQAVSTVATRFAASARPQSAVTRVAGPIFSHTVEGAFRVLPGTIAALPSHLPALCRSLTEVLRLAELASLYNKAIDHATSEAIRHACGGIPAEVSPEAAERFVSLLQHPLRLGELLRTLHELGVLEKIIPAFHHARHLLQFNGYHKYTVDEHSLRAVEAAADFFHDPSPLGDAYRGVQQKWLLHLALLLHDLGKGYAEDHSEVGRRIAQQTAERLRLKPDDAERLQFLVHKHLLMAHLAFRRDTSDERLVVQFAFEVGSPDVLRMLYVLTAADFAAVGPGVLNRWKIDVLTSLYRRTMLRLSGNVAASAAYVEQQRAEVRRSLGDVADREWFEAQIAALSPGYLDQRAPHDIAHDLRRLHELRHDDVLATGTYDPHSQTVEYTVGAYEDLTPGVFHKLTGALSGQGLQIRSAEIQTFAHGLILDRFVVHDPDYEGPPPPQRLQQVCDALRAALLSGQPPVFRRVWKPAAQRRAAALHALPVQVRTDNSTSELFTILDIFAPDEMGLLYRIARTIFELGLSVSVAKIATYLDQVVDVFYVTDAAGGKVTDEQRLQTIRQRLLHEIEQARDTP